MLDSSLVIRADAFAARLKLAGARLSNAAPAALQRLRA
jgi:hypothetical protein